MFSVKLFLCSDSASIDVRTNTISAFHITEQLMTASFPVAIPRISVVTVLNREQSDPEQIRFELEALLGGQQVASGPFPINFGRQLSARGVGEMLGLVLPSPGTLRFVLKNGDAVMASWAISVVQVGQVPIQTYFPAQLAPVPTTEDNRQQ